MFQTHTHSQILYQSDSLTITKLSGEAWLEYEYPKTGSEQGRPSCSVINVPDSQTKCLIGIDRVKVGLSEVFDGQP